MKKVMLSALVVGMFMLGSAYAQTTPSTDKPVQQKENNGGVKSHKHGHKGHHKGKGKKKDGTGKATTSPKMENKPAEQK